MVRNVRRSRGIEDALVDLGKANRVGGGSSDAEEDLRNYKCFGCNKSARLPYLDSGGPPYRCSDCGGRYVLQGLPPKE
jgi:DNA-directed RNA polymerase subunit RPC12/RpoP